MEALVETYLTELKDATGDGSLEDSWEGEEAVEKLEPFFHMPQPMVKSKSVRKLQAVRVVCQQK